MIELARRPPAEPLLRAIDATLCRKCVLSARPVCIDSAHFATAGSGGAAVHVGGADGRRAQLGVEGGEVALAVVPTRHDPGMQHPEVATGDVGAAARIGARSLLADHPVRGCGADRRQRRSRHRRGGRVPRERAGLPRVLRGGHRLHFRGLSPGARHSDRDETNRDSTLRVTPIEVSSR